MEMRKIGSLSVSVIGLGCNNFGRRLSAEQTVDVMKAAMDCGINFFDTADVYGNGQSEEFMGKALGSRRSEVIIASKFGNNMEGQGKGAHPDYIRKAVEASLKRLGTDYLDLYQQHVPDPDVPIADTLGALNELVQAGKVREIGSSNFSAEQIREADAAVTNDEARFMSVQNEYSLLVRTPENGVLAACEQYGEGFLPYFPLASGLLTGKYRKGQPTPQGTRLSNGGRWVTEHNLDVVEQLISFAEARGHSLLDLAFAWLLTRPVVSSVIAGASNAAQINANAATAGWMLTAEEMAEVDRILG
ncbi:MAG: aldo/keto reductase [Anaerolineae bacterium]